MTTTRTVPWTADAQRVKTVVDYTPGQVDVVTLDRGYPVIEVWVDAPGTVKAFVTVDAGGDDATVLQPSLNGDGCFRLNGGGVRHISDIDGALLTTVRIFSASPLAAYVVTGCNALGN